MKNIRIFHLTIFIFLVVKFSVYLNRHVVSIQQPQVGRSTGYITKTRLFKYIENFTTKKKKEKFQTKNTDIFHISSQNIDCGYSLEPTHNLWF